MTQSGWIKQRDELLEGSCSRHAQLPYGLYLTLFYPKEEFEALRRLHIWEMHKPYRTAPFIIHPTDPTYNCAAHTGFREWKVSVRSTQGSGSERFLLTKRSNYLMRSLPRLALSGTGTLTPESLLVLAVQQC